MKYIRPNETPIIIAGLGFTMINKVISVKITANCVIKVMSGLSPFEITTLISESIVFPSSALWRFNIQT